MLEKQETAMPDSQQDRRVMRRFDMRLPAIVEVADSDVDELLTETQNISARGVFLYLDRPLAQSSRIRVTLTLPTHITLTDPMRVRFTARVVRIEAPLPASRIGIAAVIEEYEFLQSAESDS
jgi:hypothetical protein